MRIVLSVHHFLERSSGAAGSTLMLAEEYRKLGHHVRIVSFDDMPSWMTPKMRQFTYPFFVACCLAWMVWANAVDVIDMTTADGWVLMTLFCKHRRRPVFVTRSTGLEHVAYESTRRECETSGETLSYRYKAYYGGFHLWEVAQSLRRADLCMFLNRVDRDFAVEHLGVRPEKTRVVPNGIPPEFIQASVERAQERIIKIAQIGTFIPAKGFTYSTQAFATLMRLNDAIEISLLGVGCDRASVLDGFDPEIRRRVNVVERYKHEELPRLLNGHSIVVFPSLYEGFGKALLEAMACGLAPVATDSPGPREIVENGVSGFLVPTRDPRAIVCAVDKLLSDPALLHTIRRAAWERSKSFIWPEVAMLRLEAYAAAGRSFVRDGEDSAKTVR